MNVDERERPDFGERFEELTSHDPFEWQRRLHEGYFMLCRRLSDCWRDARMSKLLLRCTRAIVTEISYNNEF